MPSRKELRKASGIDVRTEHERDMDERKDLIQTIKNGVEMATKRGELYYIVKTPDEHIIQMIKNEYPDSLITVKLDYLIIDWAELSDVENIKSQIREVESEIQPKLDRVKKIREWESQMVMNGGLAMMGRNDEKIGLELSISQLQQKLTKLRAKFIEY